MCVSILWLGVGGARLPQGGVKVALLEAWICRTLLSKPWGLVGRGEARRRHYGVLSREGCGVLRLACLPPTPGQCLQAAPGPDGEPARQ